jgi:hypothetical protein
VDKHQGRCSALVAVGAKQPRPAPPHTHLTIRVYLLLLLMALAFAALTCLLPPLLLFTFSTMMFFFVDTSDWSSTLVRPDRFDEFVVHEIAWAALTVMVSLAPLFVASIISYHRSQSVPMSGQNQACVTGPWTTFGWFLLALMLTLLHWMEHDLDCRMDFGYFFVCYVVLTMIHFAFLSAFRSWMYFFSDTKPRYVIEDDDDDDDDDDDEDDENIEDMEWEPSIDVTIHPLRRVHFSFELVTSTHIVPRDRLHEVARGRAGRALPSIPEGPERVHFFEDLVSKTHFVPRDSTNEIARGRQIVEPSCERNDDDDEDNENIEDMECEPSIDVTIHPLRRVHFSFELVASTHIVPRDSANEVARGRPFVAPSFEKNLPGRLFLSSGRALPSIPEGPERVHFFADLVSKTHFVPRDSTN